MDGYRSVKQSIYFCNKMLNTICDRRRIKTIVNPRCLCIVSIAKLHVSASQISKALRFPILTNNLAKSKT